MYTLPHVEECVWPLKTLLIMAMCPLNNVLIHNYAFIIICIHGQFMDLSWEAIVVDNLFVVVVVWFPNRPTQN